MLFFSFDLDDENPYHALPETPPPQVEPAAGEPGGPSRRPREGGCRNSPKPRVTVGRRTAPRGLRKYSARQRDAAVQASGARRRLGERGTFPPCKPLKTNETELESCQILPVRRTPMQRGVTISPDRRSPDAASVLGVVRGKSRVAKFSYPQPPEKAGNREGIWPAVAHAQGTPRLTPAVSSISVGRAGANSQ
jgi:hypothetical protein